ADFAALQKATAQQRQFLHLDGVSPDERKVGPHGKCGSYPVGIHALKCEHAESHILSEARQNKLHHCIPSKITFLGRAMHRARRSTVEAYPVPVDFRWTANMAT